MKKCSCCKEIKDISLFGKNITRKDGYRSECKECTNKRRKEYVSKNKDLCKQRTRASQIKASYGISYEVYTQMEKEQGYVCALCGKEEKHKNKKLAVDHCHTTNKVRALLCMQCNQGLGKFYDNPQLLRDAADYIERHNG